MSTGSTQQALSPTLIVVMAVFVLGIAVLAIWYGRTR
jgi:preprotein translocase subunit Sec61beta